MKLPQSKTTGPPPLWNDLNDVLAEKMTGGAAYIKIDGPGIPGQATDSRRSEGNTLTHEVGHWMGIY